MSSEGTDAAHQTCSSPYAHHSRLIQKESAPAPADGAGTFQFRALISAPLFSKSIDRPFIKRGGPLPSVDPGCDPASYFIHIIRLSYHLNRPEANLTSVRWLHPADRRGFCDTIFQKSASECHPWRVFPGQLRFHWPVPFHPC